MTNMQLLESLQFLDDSVLEESETFAASSGGGRRKIWLRWGSAAACLLVIAGVVYAASRRPARETVTVPAAPGTEVNFTTPQPQQAMGEPQPGGVPGTNGATAHAEAPPAYGVDAPVPDILAWNDVDASAAVQADWALASGVVMVGERLTREQLAECMPEILLEWMENAEGYASYLLHDGSGGLAYVELKVTNAAWGGTTTVRIRDKDAWQIPTCVVGQEEDEKVSAWNGMEYRAYRHYYYFGEGDPNETPPQPWAELSVKFERENLEYTLLNNVPQTEEQSAALDLRDLLLSYSGTHRVPDLGSYRCGEYVHRDEELSFAEAKADPDYGVHLPLAEPEGFNEVYIRRYQLGRTGEALSDDWLLAQWYQSGQSGVTRSLIWRIEPVTEDAKARLVSPSEREKYDFSLYPAENWYYTVASENRLAVEQPTFRAGELTPELLNARVHYDYDGAALLKFSVLYFGVLVSIDARGVSPEWIWEALPKVE